MAIESNVPRNSLVAFSLKGLGGRLPLEGAAMVRAYCIDF